MNFLTLKNKVKTYINSDATPLAGDWINLVQRQIQRQYNFKNMEVRSTTSTSEMYISAPPSPNLIKEIISIRVQEDSRYYTLIKDSPTHAFMSYPFPSDEKGRPVLYAVMPATNEIVVRPTPDKVYLFDLYYYRYLPELSADTDTNWFTDNAWEILFYGTLIEGSAFANNEKIGIWQELYERALKRLIEYEQKDKWGGGYLNLKADYIV